MDVSDWIALAAFAVSIAAAVFARRANQLSEQANATADQSVREEVRARISATAPTFTLRAGELSWPPLRPERSDIFGPLSRWDSGHEFRTGTYPPELIGLRCELMIHNGPVRAKFQVTGDLAPKSGRIPLVREYKDLWLEPDQQFAVKLQGFRKLSEWITPVDETGSGPEGRMGLWLYP
jgi:hypothetical protein